MKKVILTGDRPTGRLHVGHYVGSLKERVRLQNTGEYDEIFIMIADAQALTDNADNPEKVRQNILQVALDYLACGLDPNKVHIFIQSMVPQLTELSFYYQNLVTVSRLQRNPTVKSEIQMRNFEASIPVGFFCYPISQAADITAFKATTVPAGEDQKPMIEQCCEIVHKFNSVYGETLVEPQIVLPQNAACLRLPGIDGKAKMSKSLGNCIYLSEEPEDIEKKVKSMFTDPNHLRVQDPGNVGTLLRSAAAFGFDGVLLSDGCASVWAPKTLRASMGAAVRIPVIEAGKMPEAIAALRAGCDIVTDTQMAKAGINKTILASLGGEMHCFMSDADVAAEAKERGVTRAFVSMERAAALEKPCIFAIGNAPTALFSLEALMETGKLHPALIIGVPVGFVNVVESKERIIEAAAAPYIVARGRKGGSNVAAAICNAMLYQIRR